MAMNVGVARHPGDGYFAAKGLDVTRYMFSFGSQAPMFYGLDRIAQWL